MSETHKIEIVNDRRSGLGTASLVLGIIGLVLSFIPFVGVVGIVLGFIGLALGIPALVSYMKKKKGSLGKAIAGLILSLLAVIIGIAFAVSTFNAADKAVNEINNVVNDATGESTEAILADVLDVSFDTFKTDGNQYYEGGSLKVTVSNKSNEKFSGSIGVEALDSAGTRIETDTVYINDLAAGQSLSEEIFKLVGSDKYSQMRSATFKAYSISKY